MSIDTQRYLDASIAWLRSADMLLLTPGWRESTWCLAECDEWSRMLQNWMEPFNADERDASELPDWIATFQGELEYHHVKSRPPRVYVAGPYLTGVDGPYDEGLFRFAVHLVMFGDPVATRVMAADGRGGNGDKLATNILNGLDWCKRVLDAGGYPYYPWADALLMIASPSAMSCTCESDEGYCSLHGPSLQQQRIDAFPSIFG